LDNRNTTTDHRPDGKDAAAKREQALERLIDMVEQSGDVGFVTDKYFTNTRQIVEAVADTEATYAVFMRRRVIAALAPVLRLLVRYVPEAEIETFFAEGDRVPSEKKLLEIRGPFAKLSEVETLLLQKVGFPCVCANNAFEMCRAVPYAGFIDMHARHGSGAEMNLLAAYGAAVGTDAARAEDPEVKGFIGSSQDLTAPLFGRSHGMGTMPHSLVGYTGGDVVEAMKHLEAVLPNGAAAIALVDYRGAEITDALSAARWFYDDAKLHETGRAFGVRLDTHGARFAEGLDYESSVDLVGEWMDIDGEYNIAEAVLGTRAYQLDQGNVLVDRVRRLLFGTGVSIASVISMRRALDKAGYDNAQIVASSGFDAQKCQVVGAVRAPVDVIGTGSFLPATLSETYATADVIDYGGARRVKLGREFLYD
jgi:nicotinate phosphoribosyltransferase